MLLSRVCKDAGAQAPNDSDYHIAFRNKVTCSKILKCHIIVTMYFIQEVDNLYGMGRTRSTLHRKAYVHKTKVAVEEMYIIYTYNYDAIIKYNTNSYCNIPGLQGL